MWGEGTGDFVDPVVLSAAGVAATADVDGDGRDELVTSWAGVLRVTDLDDRVELVHEEPVDGWSEFAATALKSVVLEQGSIGIVGTQWEKIADDHDRLHLYLFWQWSGSQFARIESHALDVEGCPETSGFARLLPATDIDANGTQDIAVGVSRSRRHSAERICIDRATSVGPTPLSSRTEAIAADATRPGGGVASGRRSSRLAGRDPGRGRGGRCRPAGPGDAGPWPGEGSGCG